MVLDIEQYKKYLTQIKDALAKEDVDLSIEVFRRFGVFLKLQYKNVVELPTSEESSKSLKVHRPTTSTIIETLAITAEPTKITFSDSDEFVDLVFSEDEILFFKTIKQVFTDIVREFKDTIFPEGNTEANIKQLKDDLEQGIYHIENILDKKIRADQGKEDEEKINEKNQELIKKGISAKELKQELSLFRIDTHRSRTFAEIAEIDKKSKKIGIRPKILNIFTDLKKEEWKLKFDHKLIQMGIKRYGLNLDTLNLFTMTEKEFADLKEESTDLKEKFASFLDAVLKFGSFLDITFQEKYKKVDIIYIAYYLKQLKELLLIDWPIDCGKEQKLILAIIAGIIRDKITPKLTDDKSKELIRPIIIGLDVLLELSASLDEEARLEADKVKLLEHKVIQWFYQKHLLNTIGLHMKDISLFYSKNKFSKVLEQLDLIIKTVSKMLDIKPQQQEIKDKFLKILSSLDYLTNLLRQVELTYKAEAAIIPMYIDMIRLSSEKDKFDKVLKLLNALKDTINKLNLKEEINSSVIPLYDDLILTAYKKDNLIEVLCLFHMLGNTIKESIFLKDSSNTLLSLFVSIFDKLHADSKFSELIELLSILGKIFQDFIPDDSLFIPDICKIKDFLVPIREGIKQLPEDFIPTEACNPSISGSSSRKSSSDSSFPFPLYFEEEHERIKTRVSKQLIPIKREAKDEYVMNLNKALEILFFNHTLTKETLVCPGWLPQVIKTNSITRCLHEYLRQIAQRLKVYQEETEAPFIDKSALQKIVADLRDHSEIETDERAAILLLIEELGSINPDYSCAGSTYRLGK